jgi:hypothetical protein
MINNSNTFLENRKFKSNSDNFIKLSIFAHNSGYDTEVNTDANSTVKNKFMGNSDKFGNFRNCKKK